MNGFAASPPGVPPGGPPGAPPPPSTCWREHRTPDGRVYFYNSVTKVTQWTKPEELMTPAERSLANQPWKEYTAEGGRKYWYNTETQQSSWEMPEAFKNALGAGENRSALPPPTAPSGPAAITSPTSASNAAANTAASTASTANTSGRQSFRDPVRNSRDSSDQRQLARSFVPATESAPEYATQEEAIAAFTKALRRHGVQHDWTWEQAVRAVAKDPQFRAIRKPKVRRETFEKFCHDMVAQEKERAQERFAKLRADFQTMLKRHPEIKHYTRWKTARPMLEGETHFRATDDETERRQLFDEYIVELRKKHKEEESAQRKAAIDAFRELLPKLDITASTRWLDGQQIISKATQDDAKYKALTKCDILLKFQDHVKALERALNAKKQHDKTMRFRQERRNRDGFRALLTELVEKQHIKAGTKWSHVYHLFADDPRYLNMLGQTGITSMEMFWYRVHEEDLKIRENRNYALDVLQDKRFELTPQTSIDEFLSVMRNDTRTASLDEDTLRLIYNRLLEKLAAKREDERHLDRHQRRALDDLRSHMRHLDPPIKLGDTWESVRPRLSSLAEFQAVGSEDATRYAFDRHMRRLRERPDEDHDRDHRKNSRVSSDRDMPRRNRDRSRGERSHRGGRHSRRSRSQEPDPYEDDRRRAVAERERNHRKSAMAENVLSAGDRARLSPPPRRERDRDYRERDRGFERYGRGPRRSDEGGFAREREPRERDLDRERPFRRGVDSRSVEELNYGDDGPAAGTASRRRRPEEDDGPSRREQRDAKRIKREGSREREWPAEQKIKREGSHERTAQRETRQRIRSPVPRKQAVDVRSGSEEGEIEE
ncbi:hypothetical protein CDD80_7203 [Ophiocordyceps camponoti-rufipedis]|uniref:Pre-mRNA-processing protein prp40 n=1 Tax=Ophiocordyceps camponoti-rufipedis TaxID=2004952 RepID=A0A2C5YML2_9HYPO|nr:hypothetical protein CDD80_7203 [Ophiocordyceps camponoti-rufipedis]